jgi:hypothetical protein
MRALRLLALAVGLIALALSPTVVLAAVEARCNELVANCICSEPMNTNSYTLMSGSWYNPADTSGSDKMCTFITGLPGSLIDRGSPVGPAPTGVNSGEIWNALPSGHGRTFVAKMNEGHTGQLFIAGQVPGGSPTARREHRLYVYYSPNFIFSNDGVCLNSGKVFQFSEQASGLAQWEGSWHMHAFGTGLWGAVPNGYDCCYIAPGQSAQAQAMTAATFRGKWWRYSAIYRNLPGPQLILEFYMKDITTGAPEFLVFTTAVTQAGQPGGDNWTTTQVNGLSLSSSFWFSMYDLFRNGGCAGYNGFANYMIAAWSTDAGQRIPASLDMEGGGGGGTSPPSAPINLTVSPSGIFWPDTRVAALVAVAILTALLIRSWPRRRA